MCSRISFVRSRSVQTQLKLQEQIKLLQEEAAAAVNESTGRSLFLLTVMTVLALPINILAGLFGMNVGGIPFSENSSGFWIIAVLVSGFAGAATWWVVNRGSE